MSNPESVKTCPHCKRKLLVQTSVLCSWCGMKIEDDAYQAQAAEARRAQDEAERAQIEAVQHEEEKFGVFGRLKRRGKQEKKAGRNALTDPSDLSALLLSSGAASQNEASPPEIPVTHHDHTATTHSHHH